MAHIAGCAAVSADGRALLAPFDLPPAARRTASLYAEWQGARLGLRLAEGWTSGRLLTDHETVAGQLQGTRGGRRTRPPAIGGNDEPAMAEIHRRARAAAVAVVWLPTAPACTPRSADVLSLLDLYQATETEREDVTRLVEEVWHDGRRTA